MTRQTNYLLMEIKEALDTGSIELEENGRIEMVNAAGDEYVFVEYTDQEISINIQRL